MHIFRFLWIRATCAICLTMCLSGHPRRSGKPEKQKQKHYFFFFHEKNTSSSEASKRQASYFNYRYTSTQIDDRTPDTIEPKRTTVVEEPLERLESITTITS